ncbi:hypothetical protein M0802_007890 [Mischocyttarus mexicanus]|nr:hypothetical protein M0802_007890 [Mischocyttarus mexicanus]
MSTKRKLSNPEDKEKVKEATLRTLFKEFGSEYKTKMYTEMYKAVHAKVTPNLVRRKVRRYNTLSEPSTTFGADPWNDGNDFRAPRKTAKIQKTAECSPIATNNVFTALEGASKMEQLNATTNKYSGMQSTNKAESMDTPKKTNRSKPPPI